MLALFWLASPQTASPEVIEDELFVADHHGELWRLGAQTPYRVRVGTLPEKMVGLAFEPGGQLLGLTPGRALWRIDPDTGTGVEIVQPAQNVGSGDQESEYRDFVQGEDGIVYLLRRFRPYLGVQLTRLDMQTGDEEVLTQILPADGNDSFQVFSMIGRGDGRFWLMGAQTLYEMSLDDPIARELQSGDIASSYPNIGSYGMDLDSTDSVWVLADWTDGAFGPRLVPADLSQAGYAFTDESRPLALAIRPAAAGCRPDALTHCFQQGRFQVRADWTDFAGADGSAKAVELRSDEAGQFWFFSPENREILVKMLDGCSINGMYWASIAAGTDVEFNLQVLDRQTGAERVYSNPLGQAAQTVLDIEAFPCTDSAREAGR